MPHQRALEAHGVLKAREAEGAEAPCALLMASMVVMTPALLVAGILSIHLMTRGSDSRRWQSGAAQSSSLGVPRTPINKKWTACQRCAAEPRPSASRVPSSSRSQVMEATAPVLVQTLRPFASYCPSCPDHTAATAALAFCLVAGYATWRSMRALPVRKAETTAGRGRLVIGLMLGDPERGATTRDAPLLWLLYGGSLYEVSRRMCPSRAAYGGLSHGGAGLHLI